ncbi:right-handed parallel beta-helix repeat-containing protein [Arthrobacter bambusae]|uniref:Right handed beta helix domain-containing protein n=1 Tax=Arthrobacter bambusae TaxID=1338426 RepID=A0AAW8DDG2_9MICC|nr:right-handed parallel beta-helix repeat-containing protein [Arthrobacter bambusae]MDP9904669.1 hypothetical protein [Arthrobacter bambusae]MDQ0129485.1 hypothetical protein [Arthrobacter bambusae]MDQ0180902.1 hypothetical protein [Arthrobacter bambusae]
MLWSVALCLALSTAAAVLAVDRGASAGISAGATGIVSGTTYFIDANGGEDSNSGTSPTRPWKTLARASIVTLEPGDAVLLARGSTWKGQTLQPMGSGTPESPIRIGAYGAGTRPHIAPGIGVKTYAIHLVDDDGYRITDLELSDTYGGIVAYSRGTYEHRYLWIENVFFHDITGKDTGFNTTGCATCYPAPDLRFGTGIAFGGRGDGHSTVFSDITVKDSEFLRTDAGIETVPAGTVNPGMWRNLNIVNSRFTDSFRTGAIDLYYVSGGTTSEVMVKDTGAVGMNWGIGAFQIVGSRDYTVQDSKFLDTKRPHNCRDKNGALIDCPDGVGFDFESDNQHITLRESTISGNAGPAILFPGNNPVWPGQQSDLVIDHNTIENNNSTDSRGDTVFYADHDATWNPGSAGVFSNNTIRLRDQGQDFATAPLIFDPDNLVYDQHGTLVFSGPAKPTATDDASSPAFVYRGTPGAPVQSVWQSAKCPGCSGGTTTSSDAAGATYTAFFDGTQAVLRAPVGPQYGTAAISVDGSPEAYIDTYSGQAVPSRPIFVTGILPNGAHRIHVRVTGTKNNASTGIRIGVDALAVAGGT